MHCDPMDCSTSASLSFTNSWSLFKLASIELIMPFNHLILCCSLLLMPSIFPSIKVFSNELALHNSWYSSEYSVLISFSIDWFDPLAVQGTLKSFFQHHSWKTSILCCSALFMFQLSYPYMTTEKAITLTIWTFVNKVMSLLFNMLFRCK